MDGYGNVSVYPDFQNTRQRRDSADSTIVNFDEGGLPAYEEVCENIPLNAQDVKDADMGGQSPPAHEIRLEDVTEKDEGVEMVEKTHAPLYSLSTKEVSQTDNDGSMEDLISFDGQGK